MDTTFKLNQPKGKGEAMPAIQDRALPFAYPARRNDDVRLPERIRNNADAEAVTLECRGRRITVTIKGDKSRLVDGTILGYLPFFGYLVRLDSEQNFSILDNQVWMAQLVWANYPDY